MNRAFRSSNEKLEFINRYLNKLMTIAESYAVRGEYNFALSALSARCKIQYSINQVYADNRVEELLLEMSKKIITVPTDYHSDINTVLFYDGFGLDLRGWAASFVRALSSLNYNLIYVAPAHQKGNIPHIVSEIARGNGRIEYIEVKNSYLKWVSELNSVFNHYRPHTAFFYTNPNDLSGTLVFDAYEGMVKRIQVDLTDHAFWIGTKAVDYCVESRDIGASNAIYHRGILKERILKMDCCPYINRDIDPEPLPFDIDREEFVFSGGSLYKTLGDEKLYFYRIIDHILKNHEEIKFLFAGGGDDTEINKMIQKYPDRMFHIRERSDFIRLFQHCLFFLNTYPMFGGLMMRYAAMVGKIPLTLKHSSDHEGILYNQDKRGIEFNSYEELLDEADKLIDDPDYRRKKEGGLIGAVITEQDFEKNIKLVIEENRTEDSFEYVGSIDTTEFRAEYLKRLKADELVLEAIANRQNAQLKRYFPGLFVKKILRRIL